MNLVNELQVSAERDDVLTVLRKTMRLASKLDRKDISVWLDSEQDGYPEGTIVPDYRRIRVTLAYNTNGYIPAGYGRLMSGVQDLPGDFDTRVPISNPLSSVMEWIAGMDKGNGVYQHVDDQLDRLIRQTYRFNPMISQQISLLLHLNAAEVRAIPERIKDKVLRWALALESAGVTGDGMTFSLKEKEIAHSVTFNITGSNIEQLSSSGVNLKGQR